MRSVARHVTLVIFLGGLVTSLAEAATGLRPTLIVRTYEATPIAVSTWAKAVDAATALLEDAGFDIEWVQCSSLRAGEQDSGPVRCTLPYSRNEVGVRIVRRPAMPPRDRILLGDSMVDVAAGAGTLATIYVEPVETMARDAGVSDDAVMARAMAHELGHLLLGTTAHSKRGLMRPVWRAAELARNRASDWAITADDGARMRVAFAQRMESPRQMATH